MNIFKTYLILTENKEMKQRLRDNGFYISEGHKHVRGVKDLCYIVPVHSARDINQVKSIGQEHECKSIIEVKQGYGWRIDLNTDTESYLGSTYFNAYKDSVYIQVGSELFTYSKEA